MEDAKVAPLYGLGPTSPCRAWVYLVQHFPLTGWVDNNPAFRAVLVIATLGNEDVAGIINGIGPRAFVNRISQAVFPPVDFAVPHKYHSATAILIA